MPKLTRRQMVAGMAVAAGTAAMPGAVLSASPEEITWMPGWMLRDKMVSRQMSASNVTEHFLARIANHDSQLNAFRIIDAEGARSQARAADTALGRGEAAGSLHGIPIAVKESLAVKGFAQAARGGQVATVDDIIVERLRRAGAIIVGTTVMPGMGNWIAQQVAYGTTAPTLSDHPRNPWDLDRVPGSSSAGSAAAAAAALVPITIGGDGGGSTRLPAALSGVVGAHTAFGRIPSVSYDKANFSLTNTHGPMCRDLRDAATVMQAVSGPDGRDFTSIQDEINFLQDLDGGVAGLKFAWTDDYGLGELAAWKSSAVIAKIRGAAQQFTQLGAQFEETREVWPDFYDAYQKTGIFYGAGSPGRLGNGQVESSSVREALELREQVRQIFARVFDDHSLLLSPTLNFTAPTVEAWDDAWSGDTLKNPLGFAPVYTSTTHIYNWIGWPAISVPVGFVDGLPVGLQISAPPSREAMIYRAAAALMKAHPFDQRPPID